MDIKSAAVEVAMESRNRIRPLLRAAQILVITAAPAILAPLNSYLLWVRIGLAGAKIIHKQ